MFSFRVEREDPRPEPAGDPSKKGVTFSDYAFFYQNGAEGGI